MTERRRSFFAALLERMRRTWRDAGPATQPTESAESIDLRSLFDPAWYLATYKDIADAGGDPFDHFVKHGEVEGRDPSAAFSTNFYRATYMADEPLDASPTRHYLHVGRALGHDPAAAPIDTYAMQVLAQEQSYGLEIPDLLRHIEIMTVRPRFVVCVDGADPKACARSEDSVQRQIYPDWQLSSTREEIIDLLGQPDDEPKFLVWLEAGDILHSSALYCYASMLNADPGLDLIYGDEDNLTDRGLRTDPFYKPTWSPDYLEACNYVGAGACVRGEVAAAALSDVRGTYDLLLRVTEHLQQVQHVRRVLVHRARRLDAPKAPSEIAVDIAALEGRLERTGRSGTVTALRPDLGCYDVKIALAATPLVSVVIPTAGRIVEIGGRMVDLILHCLEAVRTRSTYKNLEFIVVDNGDINETRMAALHAFGVRTITYDLPEVNVARKLNLGVAAAQGDFVLLLNDDVEPLTPDWIERLLEHFDKPNVGVVGAKLLYPDMTTQHVGVILNGGNPDHPRVRFPREDTGYFFSTCAVRDFLAITGAVMLVRTALFRDVGGYTEALAIAFNDVDFCFKLRARGARAVYAPAAELIHHESLSRSRTVDQTELDYIHTRWAQIATDPFYNEESLALTPATYEVRQSGVVAE